MSLPSSYPHYCGCTKLKAVFVQDDTVYCDVCEGIISDEIPEEVYEEASFMDALRLIKKANAKLAIEEL